MKRWWWVIALLFLSVGVNLGLVASFAARVVMDRGPDFDERRSPPPDQRLEELAGRLGLAPEERQEFVQLQRQLFHEMGEKRRALEHIRRELKAELAGPEPDEQRIGELIHASARAYAEVETTLARHVLEARQRLDGEAEQRYLHLLGRLGQHGPRPMGERPRPRRGRGDRPPGGG